MKNIAILLILFIFTGIARGMAPPKKNTQTGILLVAFGTSYSNGQKALDNIDATIKNAFPNNDIRWAFSSGFIRKKLEKQGRKIDSPEEALARMAEEGFQKIAVQSLHIIPGEEFEKLNQTVTMFNHLPDYPKIILASPLLYKHADLDSFCKSIVKIMPPDNSRKNAIILLGHGTSHASNIYYPGLQYYLYNNSPQYILGTIEGYPGQAEVISQLAEKKISKVKLLPLMSVAGDHVKNDMAGNHPDSWKSILEKKGYQVNVSMHGLGEYKQIVDIWINHLKKILNELEK